MTRTWPIRKVRFWEHPQNSNINDCFGNTISWEGKARTDAEAIRKTKKHYSLPEHRDIRLHSVEVKN